MQVPVHAQERVLAKLARIVGMANHSIDNVPAEPLVGADQRLECPGRTLEHGCDQDTISVDAVAARPFDARWLARPHRVIDTGNGQTVATAVALDCNRRPNSRIYYVRSKPYRLGH